MRGLSLGLLTWLGFLGLLAWAGWSPPAPTPAEAQVGSAHYPQIPPEVKPAEAMGGPAREKTRRVGYITYEDGTALRVDVIQTGQVCLYVAARSGGAVSVAAVVMKPGEGSCQ